MANKIVIHLNVNRKGEGTDVTELGIELMIDGLSVGSLHATNTDLRAVLNEQTQIASLSKDFYANPGVHTMYMLFYYSGYSSHRNIGGNFSRSLKFEPSQFVIENNDIHYTINAYEVGGGPFCNDNNVELLDGNVEMNAAKAAETKAKGQGCYVATCVYGSYDCPEVWTLRRYRDDTLGASWYGRLFVRVYYAVSPTLVKWFGETRWFKRLWRGKLDRMVKKLQDKGVESTPYKDKNW